MNTHGLWDSLTDRERKMWTGNTDPWRGPVDPCAQERELDRWKRQQNTRETQREQESCGCWMRDCAECMARISDGLRPAKGVVRAAALRCDALLQRAKEAVL